MPSKLKSHDISDTVWTNNHISKMCQFMIEVTTFRLYHVFCTHGQRLSPPQIWPSEKSTGNWLIIYTMYHVYITIFFSYISCVYVCACVCLHVCPHVHVCAWMWILKDSLQEMVLSFYTIGSGDWLTWVVRPGTQCLHPVNHLTSPHLSIEIPDKLENSIFLDMPDIGLLYLIININSILSEQYNYL